MDCRAPVGSNMLSRRNGPLRKRIAPARSLSFPSTSESFPMSTLKRGAATILGVLLVTSGASAQPPSDSLRGALLGLAVDPNVRPLIAEQVDGLANLIGLEVSTSPTGASTGGFTFTFDSALGTFTRSSPSFGPAFAER